MSWPSRAKRLAAEEHEGDAMNPLKELQHYGLPGDLDAAVCASLNEWAAGEKVRRLWAGDATLWTSRDEASWLGWLGITDDQLTHIDHLRRVAEDARTSGFSHVLLLG